MATRQSNLQRNLWTVDLLDLQPDDRVLELGPGPGVTLGVILDNVPNGLVVGLDHSATMLQQCRSRHMRALEAGRLTLIEGSFSELPELPGPFNKILAVNSLQFDSMSADTLRQIIRYLVPGGTIAVTFQPRGKNPTNEKAVAFGEKIAKLLAESGMANIRVKTLTMEPVYAVCVVAGGSQR